MFQRALNFFLLAAALIGALLAWQAGRQRNRAQTEYARLVRLVGELPVEDPGKVYFRSLPTEAPLEFAWRVYLPPNYQFQVRYTSGGSSMTTSANSGEFVARVRFKQDERGGWQVYERFYGGSGLMSIGRPELMEFLKDRWDQIHVEQLGSPQTAVLDINESAVLLRLTLPPELEAEARAKLPAHVLPDQFPVLYEVNMGPQAPIP